MKTKVLQSYAKIQFVFAVYPWARGDATCVYVQLQLQLRIFHGWKLPALCLQSSLSSKACCTPGNAAPGTHCL